MAAAAAGGGPGRDISLAALRRHDPYISRIVDVASQVALYAFGPRASEWEKTDVEGTLFVYTRSASPKHGFTIMNRLSMENRTEPITKDLDFQLQDPFLLYRNARCLEITITGASLWPSYIDAVFGDSRLFQTLVSIYGIWFYDKEECQRIAELMKNLTQCEQLKAHQSAGAGIPPGALGSREGKEVDILRMLTKARDEYTKCKTCSEPKQITSSSAIYDNPNLIKPIPVKPSENPQHRGPQASQTFDPEPQHLSLTALFGRQDKAACQEIMGRPPTLHHHQQQQQQEQPVGKQGVVGALPSEEPGRPSPRLEKPLCPAIQKLLVRSADHPPLSELPGDPLCRSGHRPPAVDGVPGAPRTQHLMEKPQSSPGSPAGLCRTPHSASRPVCLGGALPPPASEQQQGRGTEPAGPTLLAGAQGGSSGLAPLLASARPALAPKFPAAARSSAAGKPSESWIHSEKQPPPSQVISSQRVPAAAAPPLLVSPVVFTQAPAGLLRERSRGLLAPGTPDRRAAPAGLLVPLQKPEPALAPGGALSKRQLQEALLHLIQNDDNFLNIIYEAYLFSMTQAAVRKTL